MSILVTGGAGYIGSHTTVELLNEGYQVVVVDNLANSSKKAIDRVEKITGKKLKFYELDIRNYQGLKKVFEAHKFEAVMHFAGLKSVNESIEDALNYYHNNVGGALNLLKVMEECDVKKMIFSSSAVIYDADNSMPVKEDGVKGPINPYGQTKSMIEQILKDIIASKKGWQFTSLRYFNPVGAHESGLIGEDPSSVPNNLLPYISQVAIGKLETLKVFGNDYDTVDGTGVRDYIHVVDLAKAHVAALKKLAKPNVYSFYNIGTGYGTSVLKMIKVFEKASGKKISYEIVARRPGDIACCYADPSLAKDQLDWRAEKNILDICRDSWNWQVKNPNGYK